MKTTVAAERLMDAPADTIYHCIADYREHHRPGGFLPSAFTDFEIEAGGVGAGTRASWTTTTSGRSRRIRGTISEPEPGRRLVETADDLETTFLVLPEGERVRVRIVTVIDEGGIKGVMNRLFAGRILRPLFEEELASLEAYARAHAPHE